MGFGTGLALEGFLPVCFIPRFDFLILAANQIVNHLDKLPLMGWNPKVIIRTAVGASKPLNPGPQHTQNHTEGFRKMLQTITVIEMMDEAAVMPGYKHALSVTESCIVVEHMELY